MLLVFVGFFFFAGGEAILERLTAEQGGGNYGAQSLWHVPHSAKDALCFGGFHVRPDRSGF